MNPRQRRLQADYDRMLAELPENEFVRVSPVGLITPPERYIVTFNLPGLRWNATSKQAVLSYEHKADIYLHSGYPRQKPKCVLLTAIWHPNFGKDICIGDHWAAGETLVDVIVQIADMIQYKVYNTKSPLNVEAARWAEKNGRKFPVGRIDILTPQTEKDMESVRRTDKASGESDFEIELGPVVKGDIEIEIR